MRKYGKAYARSILPSIHNGQLMRRRVVGPRFGWKSRV